MDWGHFATIYAVYLAYGIAGWAFWIGVIIFPFNWWRRTQRLKLAGQTRHRVRAFARRRSGKPALEAEAAKLDEEALLWAYLLPDHTGEAKKVVVQELARRQVTPERIRAWFANGQRLAVPPAVQTSVPWRRYARMAANRARWFALYRVLIVASIPLMVIMGAQGPDEKSAHILAGIPVLLLIELSIILSILYRRRSLRILLLRPFGERRMTRTLKRFVPRNLGKIGHVYTLSDRHYRPNLFIVVLLAIGSGFNVIALYMLSPFIRSSLRIAAVRNERTFRRIGKFLIRQYRPSLFSFLTGGQAFNIRSTDAWWQLCIQMLMSSCQIIVVDLSRVKEGTAWEIAEIRARALTARCLFVVAADQQGEVADVLERHFGAMRPVVFAYDSAGRLADKASFEQELRRIALASKLVSEG